MRLYLSSFQLGNQPQELTRLVGSNNQVAIILNAGDAMTPQETVHPERFEKQKAKLAEIGLIGTDLDLRNFFGKPEELRQELSKYGGVWVPGGNVFLLRRAMLDSGFDKIIAEMLHEDRLVYAGFSAGVCVLAESLRGIDLCDVPPLVETTYGKEIVWEGVGILPYMTVPHYKSDHPESAMMEDVVGYMDRENLPYKTLHDGEVILIEGAEEKILT